MPVIGNQGSKSSIVFNSAVSILAGKGTVNYTVPGGCFLIVSAANSVTVNIAGNGFNLTAGTYLPAGAVISGSGSFSGVLFSNS